MSAALRAVVLVAALAACAWLTLQLDSANRRDQAQRELFKPRPSRADLEGALRRLNAEAPLDPRKSDRLALVTVLELRAGHAGRARRTAEELVRLEPANSGAWQLLADVTRRSDPMRSAAARTRARALLGAATPSP